VDDVVDAVKINRKAGLGLPLMAKLIGRKGENPDVLRSFSALTLWMHGELLEAVSRGLDAKESVWKVMNHWKDQMPYLIACYGKTKGDYYKVAKMEKAFLRFYVGPAKCPQMIAGQATQALEEDAESMLVMKLAGKRGHSAQGIRMSYGGTQELMECMLEEVKKEMFSYAHCGDDTLFIWTFGDYHCLASVDASAYDLTQRAELTEPVDEAIYQRLREYDELAAAVWLYQNRQRIIVLENGETIETAHGGMSGTQLQSKRNDVIMDIVCQRLKRRFDLDAISFLDREEFDHQCRKVADELSLELRVEDFVGGKRGESVSQILSRTSIKFIGYGIHYLDGEYVPVIDLARALRQLPYPGTLWEANNHAFEAQEAVRIAQIVANFGIPPLGWERPLDVARAKALAFLMSAREKVRDRQVLVEGNSAFGLNLPGTLGGMIKFLSTPFAELWRKTRILKSPSLNDVDSDEEEVVVEVPAIARPRVKMVVDIQTRVSSQPVLTAASKAKPIPPTVGTAMRAAARKQRRENRNARAKINTLTSGMSHADMRHLSSRERKAMERNIAREEDEFFDFEGLE